ncbi:MAG: hypothetical protein IJ111_13460 [Eggerthellaceae bacterium]|nr:hypothetical protein [Eggerthellaceae bacterium]
MAVKATDTVTLAVAVDVQKVETYYYQTASTGSQPERPATASPSGWQTTEFAFDSSMAIWSCQKTTLTDGTFFWGEVSKASAYQGSIEAWNRANAAFDYTDNNIDESESRLYEAMPTSLSQLDNDMEFLQDGYIPDIDETFTVWGKLGVEQINVNAIRAELLAAAALLIGDQNAVHIETDGTGLAFLNGSERVAYIDSASGVFYMTRSVVLDDMYFGDGKWKWYKRTNNNMSVKWMG